MASHVVSRFRALLIELEEEHEREIRSLTAENAALRLQAGLSEAAPEKSGHADTRPLCLEDVKLAPLATLVSSKAESESVGSALAPKQQQQQKQQQQDAPILEKKQEQDSPAVPPTQQEVFVAAQKQQQQQDAPAVAPKQQDPQDTAQVEAEATQDPATGEAAEATALALVEPSPATPLEAQNEAEAVEDDRDAENAPLLRGEALTVASALGGAILGTIVGAEADAAGGGAAKGLGAGNSLESGACDDEDAGSNEEHGTARNAGNEEQQQHYCSETDSVAPTVISLTRQDSNINMFDLKKAWIDMPEATGVWGQELDEIIAERDIRKLVAHTEGLPEPKGKRFSVGAGRVVVYNKRSMVIDPGSTCRMVWDIMGMCLISYDLINIPLMAFEYEDNFFTLAVSWITLLFWTADMFASVFTGYFSEGELVMDHCSIIANYLKTWFAVDCIVVIPDWTLTLMGSTTNVAGLGRILRAARGVRVLRLLRLLKLQKLINAFYDMIESEYMFIVVNLAKLLLFILVLNHLVACCWYFVGSCGRAAGTRNWLEDAGGWPVANEDLAWKYTTALHWSITQFTPASMDISATNKGERIFSIFILFWALVALSSIIGSVSASMTALRNMKGDEQKQTWLLRRYLRQRKVSKSLMGRIMKYTEHTAQAKQNTVAPKQVTLLSILSEQLSLELASEINSPVLGFHPFYRSLSTYFPVVMHRICNTALRQRHFAMNDKVFETGDEATSMMFVKGGTFEYRRRGPPLCKNTFVSEPVLWTVWRHRGEMVALQEPSEILALYPAPFSDAMRLHPRPWEFARRYGIAFVKLLNRMEGPTITDIIFDQEFFDRSTRLEERRAGREVSEHDLAKLEDSDNEDW